MSETFEYPRKGDTKAKDFAHVVSLKSAVREWVRETGERQQ